MNYEKEGDLPYLLNEGVRLVNDDVIEIKRGWYEDVRKPIWLAIIFCVLLGAIFTLYYGKPTSISLGEWIFVAIFLFLANIPKARPIRIDRKRRLIYFSYFGKFYIYRYQKGQINAPYLPFYTEVITRNVRSVSRYYSMLHIELPSENQESQKTIKVRLGSERVSSEVLESFIYRFTNFYLTGKDIQSVLKIGSGITLTKGIKFFFYTLLKVILNLSLLPSFGYNEKRTEKKIQAWLKKYYNE